MKVHVISLKRSLERRKIFLETNSHIDYVFFDAVDGAALPEKVLSNPLLFEKGLPYTKGAYGCALSHLVLWEKAIRDNCALTIAEDDAIFRRDFHEMQERLLNSLSCEWDIILWGWNTDSILSLNVLPRISSAVVSFDHKQLISSIDSFMDLTLLPSLCTLDKCFGIPAYTISPKGAIKYKNSCFPLINFLLWFPLLNRKIRNNGIDISMNRIYSKTKSFACFPPIVITKNENRLTTVQIVKT